MANLNKGVREDCYVNTKITSKYIYEEAYSSAATSQRVHTANDNEEAIEYHFYEEIPMNEYDTDRGITSVERLNASNTHAGNASNTHRENASNTPTGNASNTQTGNASNTQTGNASITEKSTKNRKKTVWILITIFLILIVIAVSASLVVFLMPKPQAHSSNIRLSNGTRQDHSNGRLEVFHNKTWGTVCEHNFDNNAATVVCRQLGFTGNLFVSREKAAYGAGTGQIWLDDVTCMGYETDLFTCAHKPWGVNDCGHDEDVGVDCNPNINECASRPCKNGGLCADNANKYKCTCQKGYTGITCETDINECVSGPCRNAGSCADNVNGYNCTCQQGYTGINCETDINECASGPCKNGGLCVNYVNGYACTCQQGYRGVNCEIDINECASRPCKNGGLCADKVNGYNCTCQQGYTGINCETDISECASGPCRNGGLCSNKVNGYTCTCRIRYTGINCETVSLQSQNMTVRLSGGPSSSEGRVEVFYNNTWGTVCEDDFDTKAAAVVCRMLGLPSSGAQPRFYGSGNGTIWLDDVRCSGNETSIVDCYAKPLGNNNCGHQKDVGVHCASGPPNVTVKLAGELSMFHGRVEIRVYDMWGTICDDGFGDKEATVICRMLGHHSGGTVLTYGYYSGGSGEIWLDDVKCAGNETRIQDCVHRPWGSKDCGHNEDVAVLCHSVQGPPNVTVQLTGGLSIYQGRVEIQVYNIWGTICNDGFGNKEATVICRMLGHHRDGTVLKGGSYGGGGGPIWLDDVVCSGNETRIQDCVHKLWGSNNCSHSQDVAVMCHSLQGQNVTVRLSGGASSSEGRVEVFYNNAWGTICDDNFDTKAAEVVCRMLGLSSTGAQPLPNLYYGSGNGTIWLDDVQCVGNETSIGDCKANPWGNNNCNHYDDVGVVCDTVRLCLDGWWRHGSSCYYFSNTRGNITNAQTRYNSSSGYLAEIEDNAENSFLQKIVKNLPLLEYYIGLNDIKQEGIYSWFGTNHLLSQTGYIHWDGNEPNNKNSSEDCVVMRRNGYWNDVSCNSTDVYGYICEIKY